MPDASKPRILFVDDEPDLLAAIARSLRSEHFEVVTASSGAEAMNLVRKQGSFSVVVSDLHMPEMDGVTLLQRIRECDPDIIRILFSGQPDLENAIAAVNKGAIFRFLIKPSTRMVLALTLRAAIEQHRLITAERVLLQETLNGSIRALMDVLSLAAPMAFGRANRLRQTVHTLASASDIIECWHIDMAAMLSQIGSVILPEPTLERLYRGECLTAAEESMVQRMPAVVDQVLANIPRLNPVREILRFQDKHFDGGGIPLGAPGGETIPWGARALRLALDLDAQESHGLTTAAALEILRGQAGRYDPDLLQKLAEIRYREQRSRIRDVPVTSLSPGMILAQDVDLPTRTGVLFIARGQEVTVSLLEKLRNVAASFHQEMAVRVIVGS